MDAVLKVGAVEQSVGVSAQAATLQTENGEVRRAIATTTLENVPTPIGRNYQNLLITVPGVMPPANQHSVAANPSRLTFNVNGTTRNSNNVRIDAALANNIWLPHVTAYVPGLDAIESVSMVTACADASEGMSGGSAINVQIKSGTNQIHGSLFEFHADNAIKAKPFFLTVGQGNPKYIDNQFGGSIRGPGNQEQAVLFRQLGGFTEPADGRNLCHRADGAMHAGDLSGSSTPIYDPLSGNSDGTGRTSFSGNLLPSTRIDSRRSWAPLIGVRNDQIPNSLRSALAEPCRFPFARSAARIAFTVVAFGTRTSNGNAFSAATRTSSMRTASDTEIPIPAKVLAAFSLVFSSTRT